MIYFEDKEKLTSSESSGMSMAHFVCCARRSITDTCWVLELFKTSISLEGMDKNNDQLLNITNM